MRWSDCAIQDLKSYIGLKASIENIKERIRSLEMRQISIKGSKTSSVPVYGGGSKWEDSMVDNIVERERLGMLLEADLVLLDIIERGLKALDATERLILKTFFIDRTENHIEKIANELKIEKSQVYRLKTQALQKFTTHMYGIEQY